MRQFIALATMFAALVGATAECAAQEIEVDAPRVFLKGVNFSITVSAPQSIDPVSVTVRTGDGEIVADTTIQPLQSLMLRDLVVDDAGQIPLTVTAGAESVVVDRPVLPGWVSVLPPLLAIGLALVFREVVTSLFAGVWLGCLFLAGYNPLTAIFMAGNGFVRQELADFDNGAIIIFSMLLGGMVGVITRMGGTRAIVDAVSPLATTRVRGQVATWLAGLAVFFDDYSNSLIVGNTMRPLTDRLKISREKLAYIVDSTAAPVAAIFFVSTWIGYEVGLINDGLGLAAVQHAGNPAIVEQLTSASGFGVFLQSIPYLFYPILAIVMVAVTATTGRDFGPMLRAERRAASGGGLTRPGAQLAADLGSDLPEKPEAPQGRWWNGALPVAVLVVTVLTGLVVTGIQALSPTDERSLRNIFGNSDPFSPLLWGALLACGMALTLAVSQRVMTIRESIDAWLGGVRAMLLAVVILLLAWSLGAVTEALSTADYLAQVLSGALAPAALPALVFVVAAVIAFSTGTSWATMAILLPTVVPLAVTLTGGIDFSGGPERAIVLGAIGSVLAGAIWGDHCSPISDTTVLSSTASSCDHMDHVRTQLPYAMMVGLVALMLGSIPSAFGVSPWICLLLGGVAIWAVVRFYGQPVVVPGEER